MRQLNILRLSAVILSTLHNNAVVYEIQTENKSITL